VWASFYLKGAITRIIQPRLNNIVINGPYKYCRHPLYYGISVALIGVTIALKSWLGLITVLFIVLPSEIHRAKLEEKLLLERFGDEWLA